MMILSNIRNYSSEHDGTTVLTLLLHLLIYSITLTGKTNNSSFILFRAWGGKGGTAVPPK